MFDTFVKWTIIFEENEIKNCKILICSLEFEIPFFFPLCFLHEVLMRLKIKTFKFKISLLGKKTKVFCLFVFYFWLCILVIFFKVTINYIILKFSQLSFIRRAKYDVKQVIQPRDFFVGNLWNLMLHDCLLNV